MQVPLRSHASIHCAEVPCLSIVAPYSRRPGRFAPASPVPQAASWTALACGALAKARSGRRDGLCRRTKGLTKSPIQGGRRPDEGSFVQHAMISTSILAETKSPHPPSRLREAEASFRQRKVASLRRSKFGHPLPLLCNGRGGRLEAARSCRELSYAIALPQDGGKIRP
jgi:hypothetical protein